MLSKGQGTPLDKKKPYKTIMAVIALATAAITLMLKGHDLLVLFIPVPPPMNTEIVLDRSAAMNHEFEGGTKLQAAIASVGNVLRGQSEKENLAFRQFGGACDGDNTQLVLKFSPNNAQRLRNLLPSITAEGQPSLARAVAEATNDFNDPKRFKGASTRIIVITGSDDACVTNAIDAIRENLERNKRIGYNIQLNFRFIGMGLTPSQQQNIAQISDSTGGHFNFVDRRQDLDNVLRQILIVEPVINDANSLVQFLNAGVAHINQTIERINAKDFAAAESELEAARKEFKGSDAPFHDLGDRQSTEQFRKLYQIATVNRDLQDQFLSLAETLVSRGKANDIEGFNNTIKKYNELIAAYNERIGQIDNLVQQLSSTAH